jgi:chromate transporter
MEPAPAQPLDVEANSRATLPRTCTLAELGLYFLRLGTFGFGGPIALAGRMQRDLVDERQWIERDDYLQGLALSQLSPGPLAAQLAMYLGWVRAGVRGAALVGAAFVGPSFLMVLALAGFYVRFGGLPWMQGVFYGVGAAVVAIIALSTRKLAAMALGRDPIHWACFAVTALATAWTESEIVAVPRRRRRRAPMARGKGESQTGRDELPRGHPTSNLEGLVVDERGGGSSWRLSGTTRSR